MENVTIHKILDLDKQFYYETGKDFSKTRQSAWKGWGSVVKFFRQNFKNKENISILDLGCGNGRFYWFLKNSQLNADYTGIDSNLYLLKEAKEKYPDTFFKKLDIFLNISRITKRYDSVVGFGITHHLPSRELRLKWFSQVGNLVAPEGLIILTFWNFDKKIKSTGIPGIIENDLKPNDYFLKWQNKENIYRYAHLYSKKELNEVQKTLLKDHFTLVNHFLADGKDNKSNTYYIFKKIKIE